MRHIHLTQGKFAIVDDEDYDWLMQWKWRLRPSRRTSYAQRSTGRNAKLKAKRKTIFMHRVIMDCPNNLQIDHINHNGLDNRKCNLRICTFTENRHNQQPYINGASQYKGVSRSLRKWRTYICRNGKRMYIGTYDSESEAANAYDAKAKEIFGNFAYLNFQEGA